MKTNFLIVLIALFSVVGCKKKQTVNTSDAKNTATQKMEDAQSVAINTENSFVEWLGSKVVGGSHNGRVLFDSGDFSVKNNELVGGEFVLNMKSISCDDLDDPEKNEMLVGHLSNEDFFEVDKYPTAKFKILDVEPANDGSDNQMITGVLTIKNVSKNISVPAVVSVDGQQVSMATEFNIDRTEFGINFNSASKVENLAKDKAIKDVIELAVAVVS